MTTSSSIPKTAPAAAIVDDAFVLRYAGFMGHPFAVTEDDTKLTGARRMVGECNDKATALKWAAEHRNGRAFERVERRKYRELKP